MDYLLVFCIDFIIVYIFYYIFIEKRQKKQKYKKLSADANILKKYYKLDLKSIGYKKVYKLLNITNSLLISLLVLIVFGIKNILIKILLIVILMIPMIWVGYYIVAKILEREEKKND